MQQQHTKHKVLNWGEYNKALIHRGSMTLWLSDNLVNTWKHTACQHKRGKPFTYSDELVTVCLTARHLYRLSYRATQGFMRSLFSQLNVDIPVPSYCQLCRRAAAMSPWLKRIGHHKGPIDIVVDSTGLKVFGEGEWKVRKHGADKRRTWRKLHLGVDPIDHEVVACELTENSQSDDHTFEPLLDQIEDSVERCFADGAYDTAHIYQCCYDRKAELITPPCTNAVVQSEPTPALALRDAAIRRISELTDEYEGDRDAARKRWKYERDYHCRCVAETAMFRFKSLFSGTLQSRKIATQKTEIMIKINLMNRMTALGMPVSEVIYL